MLSVAEQFLEQQMHPTVIISAYRHALDDMLDMLKDIRYRLHTLTHLLMNTQLHSLTHTILPRKLLHSVLLTDCLCSLPAPRWM
jgi:chaperonin GroEL (HSP60 family)